MFIILKRKLFFLEMYLWNNDGSQWESDFAIQYVLCLSFSEILLKFKKGPVKPAKTRQFTIHQSYKDKAWSAHTTEHPDRASLSWTGKGMSTVAPGGRCCGSLTIWSLNCQSSKFHRILAESPVLPISLQPKQTSPYNGLGSERLLGPLLCFLSLGLYFMFYQESQQSTTRHPLALEPSCLSEGVSICINKK